MLTLVLGLAMAAMASPSTLTPGKSCPAVYQCLSSHRKSYIVNSSRFVKVVATLAALTILAGCSSEPQLERDESATAQLDYQNVQVFRPLDEFKPSWEQDSIIQKAVNIATEPCLLRHGVPSRRNEPRIQLEFRNYGLWNVERAKQYGSDFPHPELIEPTEKETQAYVACQDETKDTASLFEGDFDGNANPSLAVRLDEEAYAAAIANPEWNAARDKWRQCITARGLTPNGDSWVSKQAAEISRKQAEQGITPELKQENIRVSVIEAECNQSTNLTQTLANIEASYQAPLIRKNDAALQQEKQDIANRVELARKYIQEHP